MQLECRGDDQRSTADRNVDEEDPFPAEVVGEPAAQQRPSYRGDAEHCSEESLVLAALEGDHITDDSEGQRHETAGAEALNRPAAIMTLIPDVGEIGDLRREAADQRADQEDDDRGLKDRPPTAQVGDLAPERSGRSRGQQVGGAPRRACRARPARR